jgi:hypothetical protein
LLLLLYIIIKKIINLSFLSFDNTIELSGLGINTTHRDPMYQKFIQALSQREEFKITKVSKEDRVKQNRMALDILNKLFEENEA